MVEMRNGKNRWIGEPETENSLGIPGSRWENNNTNGLKEM
jgi:hypothetical protein